MREGSEKANLTSGDLSKSELLKKKDYNNMSASYLKGINNKKLNNVSNMSISSVKSFGS